MKASEHARVWKRVARRMSRLARSSSLSRGSREALAGVALLAEEAAEQYSALASDGGGQ